MEMPVRFSSLLAMSGSGLPFKWNDDPPSRFGVMPRNDTNADVKWFDVPSCRAMRWNPPRPFSSPPAI